MFLLIEIIVEFFAEVWFGSSSDRVRESLRDKRVRRRIKSLNKHYGWFQLMYEKNGYKEIIDRHPDIHIRIMDKFYIHRVNQDIGEREIFDMYIRSKMR